MVQAGAGAAEDPITSSHVKHPTALGGGGETSGDTGEAGTSWGSTGYHRPRHPVTIYERAETIRECSSQDNSNCIRGYSCDMFWYSQQLERDEAVEQAGGQHTQPVTVDDPVTEKQRGHVMNPAAP